MAIKRREARELAFLLLYEMTFYQDDQAEEVYDKEKVSRGFEDDDYLKGVFFGAVSERETLDAIIEKYSNGWRVKRISRISLAIMRLCIFEMLYIEDIPFSVSINEAIELCKKYNDDKAVAFVNGILNAAADKEGVKEKKGDL